MDSVYTSSTENDKTSIQYNITPVSLRPTMPTDLFLTLASSNAIDIAIFISEVKDACSEFITGVRELVGDASEYSECECGDSECSECCYCECSKCCDSDVSSDDSDDDRDDDDALTKTIVANEFETIICDLKNKLNILEKTYLSAKDSFNNRMSEEIKIFFQP